MGSIPPAKGVVFISSVVLYIVKSLPLTPVFLAVKFKTFAPEDLVTIRLTLPLSLASILLIKPLAEQVLGVPIKLYRAEASFSATNIYCVPAILILSAKCPGATTTTHISPAL